MPIQYEIDANAGIVSVVLRECVTGEECIAFFRDTEADERFRPSMHRLVVATEPDATSATSWLVTNAPSDQSAWP